MKTKLVLWGENASNEKVLLAMELLERDNKVMIYVFPLEIATENLYQSLLDHWREGKHVDFPNPHQVIERSLSVSESLLPDDIKVERTDIISRAQAEWHFVVLSSKLYDMYKSELEEIKDKIEKLAEYDDKLWDEAKTFWTKVQDQVKEQNLFKEHSTILKERTNILFDKLKELKKGLQSEFEKSSKDLSDKFIEEIKEIEEKFTKGLGLKPLFEQMKSIQERYYKVQLTREHRKTVWDKLDATFKALKERKPGQNQAGGQRGDNNRLSGRYEGLVDTIGKMEKSIERDKQDYAFQEKKIEQSDGQLEMQIRKAKLKMLEERMNSKKEKLEDMYKVRKELEDKMSKDEIRKAKEDKRNEAKEVVKQKIAVEIESAKEERETMADLLENAASKIKASIKGKQKVKPAKEIEGSTQTIEKSELTPSEEQKEESLTSTISETLSESFEDLIDTVKAVAEVVGDKIEDAMDVAEDKIDNVVDSLKGDNNDVAASIDNDEVKKEEEENKA